MTNAGQWPPVRAVSFDLDYTLWSLDGVIQAAEEKTLAFFAAHYPRVAERFSLEDLREMRMALARECPDIAHDFTTLRTRALVRAVTACGYPERAGEEAFEVFLEGRHAVALYPETLDILQRLARRYRIGAITNGNADVRRLGLEGHFDFRVTAIDVGAAKPSHLVFEAACNRAGVQPEEMVHVGDDPEADVYGAARYGMRAVWVDRHDQEWPEEVERVEHVRLTSLDRLPQLLESWPSGDAAKGQLQVRRSPPRRG